MENIESLLKDLESDAFAIGTENNISNLDQACSEASNQSEEPETNFEKTKKQANSKYTGFGYEIHKKLKESKREREQNQEPQNTWKTAAAEKPNRLTVSKSTVVGKADVYAEPIFGLRIINPLVSSTFIQSKMTGKQPVAISNIAYHLRAGDKNADWVFAGVIVFKSGLKTSQKGSQYCIWKISDLRNDMKEISIYIFSKACSDLVKISVGTVIAILNATPFHKEETVSQDDLTLTVRSSDQVMIWGSSRDYGICKARKKNGDNCTSFVNKTQCEFCIYHVKSEYNKFSNKRTDLQFSSSGGFNELRNKVLGKNEVFYGGKSYSAVRSGARKIEKRDDELLDLLHTVPAKKNLRLEEADNQRLQALCKQPKQMSCSADEETVNEIRLKPRSTETPDQIQLKSPSRGITNRIQLKLPSTESSSDTKTMPKVISSRLSLIKEAGERMIKTGETTRITFARPEKRKVYSSFAAVFSSEDASTDIPKLQVSSDTKEDVIHKKDLQVLDVIKSIKTTADGRKSSPRVSKRTEKPKPKTGTSKVLSPVRSNIGDIVLEIEFPSSSGILDRMRPKLAPTDEKKEISPEFEIQFPSSSGVLDRMRPKPAPANKEEETSNSSNEENVSEALTASKVKIANISPVERFVSKNGSKVKPLTPSSSTKDTPPLLSRKSNKTLPERLEKTEDQINHSAVTKGNTEKAKENMNCNTSSTDAGVNGDSLKKLKSSLMTSNIHQRKKIMTKMSAIEMIKKKGGLPKSNPNQVKPSAESRKAVKRKLEEDEETDPIGKSIVSQRFIDLMNATSTHENLIQLAEDIEQQNYFNKMEKKEQLEDKMLGTFKVPCKAVMCLKCKYKWFSASDLCRAEGHPIKVIETFKRFFKCSNCSNRTISLDIIPLISCKNCGSSNWARAPMIRERIVGRENSLCIRGDEQTFLDSLSGAVHLNLLVPED